MPDYSSFIRSIRIRYLSGLLIFALAVGTVLFALNSMNAFRNEIDHIGSALTDLARGLHNATAFADTTAGAWREETRGDLTSAASGHATRLTSQIETLSAALAAIRPDVSAKTIDELDGASVNGDLFWSARDMVRNLGLLGGIRKIDEWSNREIRNQNDLFVQPMLIRARAALDRERVLVEQRGDRLLSYASMLMIAVLALVGFWVFRPMEVAIRRAFTETRGIPFAGRGRRSREIRIPGQYEPRNPHAHERRAGHGRASGAHRPDT